MDKDDKTEKQKNNFIASISNSFSILLFALSLFLVLLISILIFAGGYYAGYSTEHKISDANKDRALLAESQGSVLATDNFNLENELKRFKEKTERQIFTVGIEKYIYFFNSSALIGSIRTQEHELKVWALLEGKEKKIKIPIINDKWTKLDSVEVKFGFSCDEPYYKSRESLKEEQIINHISDSFALQIRSVNISK